MLERVSQMLATQSGELMEEEKRKCDIWSVAASFLEVRRGFSSETYRFQPLHCILTDVHASGLFHLHMSQVLQGRDRYRERERESE